MNWKAVQDTASKEVDNAEISMSINMLILKYADDKVKEFERKEKNKGKQIPLTG